VIFIAGIIAFPLAYIIMQHWLNGYALQDKYNRTAIHHFNFAFKFYNCFTDWFTDDEGSDGKSG